MATSPHDTDESVAIPSVPILPDGWAKRAFDLFLASVGLVVLLPLLLFCAVLAKVQSPGGVLYWGPRVGRGGRCFRMAKFRTMVADAPTRGPGITASNDPRMTPIGRFLRKTKLDELPQLFNVLNGTMSLVGPRPELPRYVARYNERQLRVLSVRPGITGPTQIAYRHEEELLRGQPDVETYYLNVIMPAKLEMDLHYIEQRRFWTDVGYLIKTLVRIFSRH